MRNDNSRKRLDVENITERSMEARLMWVGHVKRRDHSSEERPWRWFHLGEEKEEDRSRDGWTVSTETSDISVQQKMKSMTELAGGELCLTQRPQSKCERLEEDDHSDRMTRQNHGSYLERKQAISAYSIFPHFRTASSLFSRLQMAAGAMVVSITD